MSSESQVAVKYEDLFKVFYEKAKKDLSKLYVEGDRITRQNIVLITDYMMKEAGKIKTLVGVEKKTLVLKAVQKTLDDNLEYLKGHVETWDRNHQQHWDSLQRYVDKNVDPLIDQLYLLAPKVYGKVTTNKWTKWIICK
jgi:hypothetical protein